MTQVNQTMKLRTVLIGWALALVLLLLPVFVFKSQYLLYISSLTCIYMIVACGLNIVLGYAGQISLAQAGFLGIGAYVCALLGPSLSFWVVLPLAGLICFVIGLGLGFPSLRVKTHFLAMVTLGFTVIVYLILVNEEKWTGGPFGVFNIPRPKIGSLSFSSPANYHIIVANHHYRLCPTLRMDFRLCRNRMHHAAQVIHTEIFQTLGKNGVGLDIGQDDKTFLNQDLGGLQGFHRVGEQILRVGSDFQLDPWLTSRCTGYPCQSDCLGCVVW